MYLPDIELHESSTLDEACELLERHAPNARLLAGGTDLFVDLKTGRIAAQHLVSINRIETLRNVSKSNGRLVIGALATPSRLSGDADMRRRFPAIYDATSQMASPQIRNVATAGGNVVSAVPCADLPPVLMAMRASITLYSSGGQREVDLDSFFVGVRKTALRTGELLKCIVVPDPPPGFGAAFARFALREGNAIAVASVAAGLLLNEDNTIRDVRVVLGAVAPTPKLVGEAAACLIGQPADDDAFKSAAQAAAEAAEPIGDVRGSADFRRELIGVLTARALASARRRAGEATR